MSKDTKLTIMIDEDMDNYLGKIAFDSNVSKSDLVRASISMSIPTLREIPALVHIMQAFPIKKHQIITR